jgi:pyruvate carboxylase subunit B
MPGLILRIEVKEGQKVSKNQVVMIMEAMKMENEIFAPCDGVVTKISVSQGQQMQSDDELLVIA